MLRNKTYAPKALNDIVLPCFTSNLKLMAKKYGTAASIDTPIVLVAIEHSACPKPLGEASATPELAPVAERY